MRPGDPAGPRRPRRLLLAAIALILVEGVLTVGRASPAAAAGCPSAAASAITAAPAVSARTVALTFDDGPGPFLPQILQVLNDNHVPATFFDTGAHDAAFPARARQIVADGDLLEDHSWDHRYPAEVPGGWTVPYLQDQVSRTAVQQRALTGQQVCFFRPPGGFMTNVLAAMRGLGMSPVLWSVDSDDWKQPAHDSPAAVQRITRAATNVGGQSHPIVLLHDAKASYEPDTVVSPYRGNTVQALPGIIAWYQAHGYQFVELNGVSSLSGP